MPTIRDHEYSCIIKFNKPYSEVHKWMDEIRGKYHRRFRHDPEKTPLEANKLFGEGADLACLDHITLDLKEMSNNFKHPVISFRTTQNKIELLNQYAILTGTTKNAIIDDIVMDILVEKAPYMMFKKFQENLKDRNPFLLMKKCERCSQEPLKDVQTTKLVLYHIDGDTTNLNNDNVIVLCKSCFEVWNAYKEKYRVREAFYSWFLQDGKLFKD